MLDHSWEYIKRTIGRGFVLIGGGLDVLGLAIVAYSGDSEDIGLAWPIVLLILAGILIVSGFYTFQEERKKNEPLLRLEVLDSKKYAKFDGKEYTPYPCRFTQVGDDKLHIFAPMIIRATNRDGQNDARMFLTKLVLEERRLFFKPKYIRDIPLRAVGSQPSQELELAVSRAERSEEYEILFEDDWPGTLESVPARTALMLRPDYAGAPEEEFEIQQFITSRPLSIGLGRYKIVVSKGQGSDEGK